MKRTYSSVSSSLHFQLKDDTSASPRSKLTKGQVRAIKVLATLGTEPGKLNYKDAAYLMGIHNKTVYDILLGHLYPDIK